MAALLPVLSFAAFFLAIGGWRGSDVRESFLFAAVIWGTAVALSTEVLSLFRELSFLPLVLFWGAALITGLGGYGLKMRQGKMRFKGETGMRKLSGGELLLLGGVGFLIIITGVLAFVAAPNIGDSMTYHLARVVHWMQNRSVAFYPTHIPRQLHMPPWSEYAILHFQILLHGSDRMANFVQWFSMVGSVVGVSLIARDLGASSRGEVFAMVFAATIPMGILQSTSTQTDYVASFWIVAFVHFAFLLLREFSVEAALGTGLALGLGALTKATVYIFAFPFVVWVGIAVLRRLRWRKVGLMLLVGGAFVLLNLGQYIRNYELFYSLLGPGREGQACTYLNDTFTPAAFASNLIRNISLHLETPWSKANAFLENGVDRFHVMLHLSPSDHSTTWCGALFRMRRLVYHPDLSGNPLHFLLVTFVALLCLFMAWKRKCKRGGWYLFATWAGFFLFVLLLKWQPWHSRLHLPFFVLEAPLVGLVAGRLSTKSRWTYYVVVLLLGGLIIAAQPWLFYNRAKPILGRDSVFVVPRREQYFANRKSIYPYYDEAVREIAQSGRTHVGLIMGLDDWEYPIWALWRADGHRPSLWLTHVNVRNVSRMEEYSTEVRSVCAVLIITRSDLPSTVRVRGQGREAYKKTWGVSGLPLRESMGLYLPERH